MVGQLFERISVIVHDFKSSWYFRVWGVLWIICAIFVFVALIILGAKSTEADREGNWNVWFENATQIEFPGFHFLIQDPTQTIVYKQCAHLGNPLKLDACSYGGTPNNCFRVVTDGIYAINKWGEPMANTQINCVINTTNFSNNDNLMIAWALDPHNDFASNPYFASSSIRPNNEAWVLLEKRVARPRHALDNGDRELTFWRRRIHYQSTEADPGYYYVSTIIESFGVEHYEQKDFYDGWQAMGDVGGFAFFLLILHSIVMLGVGVFLANDSKFLAGGHVEGTAAEHAPLVRS
jgi:hypothetical protein